MDQEPGSHGGLQGGRRVELPVEEAAEEHGELRSDDGHHRRGDEVGGREDAVDDGHAADTGDHSQTL